MNTKFFYKVETQVEVIWQGKRKENNFLWKMCKVIEFYKTFYILGRLLNSRRKKQQPNMHVLKRGYKITHKTHPCSKLLKSLGTM